MEDKEVGKVEDKVDGKVVDKVDGKVVDKEVDHGGIKAINKEGRQQMVDKVKGKDGEIKVINKDK